MITKAYQHLKYIVFTMKSKEKIVSFIQHVPVGSWRVLLNLFYCDMSAFIKYFEYFKRSVHSLSSAQAASSSAVVFSWSMDSLQFFRRWVTSCICWSSTQLYTQSVSPNFFQFSSFYLTCLIEKSYFITHVHVLFHTGNCYGRHVKKKKIIKLRLQSKFFLKIKINLFIKIFFSIFTDPEAVQY